MEKLAEERKSKKSEPIQIKSQIDPETPWYKENKNEIEKKAHDIGKTVSSGQIKTQEQVTFFTSEVTAKCTTPPIRELTANKYMGKQIYIPEDWKSLTINDEEGEFGGIVLNKIKHTTFSVNSTVSQITVSKCEDLIIKVKGKIYAGIECLNSRHVTIEVENQYFVRCVTSHGVRLKGKLDKDVVLDFRNCMDIVLNNETIPLNEFDSVRYHKDEKNNLVKTPDDKDKFLTNNKIPVPSITIEK